MCSVIERSIQGNLNIKPNQMRLFKENDCPEYDDRGGKRSAKKGAKAIFKGHYKEYIKE